MYNITEQGVRVKPINSPISDAVYFSEEEKASEVTTLTVSRHAYQVCTGTMHPMNFKHRSLFTTF